VVLTLPIREVIAATPRARIVRLDLDGRPFQFAAGQAIKVGSRGSETRRPYSIASAPEDAQLHHHLELLIGQREDGDADGLVLERGIEVDVEGPLGSFTFPDHPAEDSFLFVAGGTGIAPLRAMLRHAILGARQPRHVGLLYSARTPDEFAFADEFHVLAAGGQIEFRQTITRETDREWSGSRGRIDRSQLLQIVHGPDTLCFVCGPRALVDEMPRLLKEIGVADGKIRIEEW
jgi:ferredoxin-NADP reductase